MTSYKKMSKEIDIDYENTSNRSSHIEKINAKAVQASDK